MSRFQNLNCSATQSNLQKYVECTILGSSGGAEAAEDSSYDSDYETEDKSAGVTKVLHHPDVSRTASDTLAAEFAEYVTVQHQGVAASPVQTPGIKLPSCEKRISK